MVGPVDSYLPVVILHVTCRCLLSYACYLLSNICCINLDITVCILNCLVCYLLGLVCYLLGFNHFTLNQAIIFPFHNTIYDSNRLPYTHPTTLTIPTHQGPPKVAKKPIYTPPLHHANNYQHDVTYNNNIIIRNTAQITTKIKVFSLYIKMRLTL